MNFLRYTTLFLNIIHIIVLLWFVTPLKWSYEPDRSSIVGFVAMLVTVGLNVLLLIFARF